MLTAALISGDSLVAGASLALPAGSAVLVSGEFGALPASSVGGAVVEAGPWCESFGSAGPEFDCVASGPSPSDDATPSDGSWDATTEDIGAEAAASCCSVVDVSSHARAKSHAHNDNCLGYTERGATWGTVSM